MHNRLGKAVLLGWLAVVGCDRVGTHTPEQPARVKAVAPPQATGFEIATLHVRPPANATGQKLYAGLKREGRIVGRGEATMSATGTTEIVVRALDRKVQLQTGKHELWLVIDRDGLPECHPGFGDLYLRDTWEWPKVEKTLWYQDLARWELKRLARPENLVTLHYHRHDEDYADLGIWTWDETKERTPEQNEIYAVGRDDFGLIFQFDRGEYGANGDSPRIGLLPRLHADWAQKDGPDKFWTPELGNQIYLIGGQATMHTSRPHLPQQVTAAYVDAPDRLVVHVSRPLAEAIPVTVTDRAGQTVPVRATAKLKANALDVRLGAPMDLARNGYSVSVPGFDGTVALTPRGILDDPELFGDRDAVLGASYTPVGTTFRVFAPTARAVNVVLYDLVRGDAGRRAVPLRPARKGIWEVEVAGDLEGKFYVYNLEGDGLAPDRDVVDIYAVNAVDNTRRARITDLAKTGKVTPGPRVTAPQDIVVYEMHVRDFTIAPNSPAKTENRGRYLGFIDGADYLKDLGVTHVQLLPVQDFENDEHGTNYNWGYITTVFNTPEGWFSSNPNDDSRIREFKQLVSALHDRGIGVILDVVYNHTSHNAPFNSIVPKYYYRLDPQGGYHNGSGCGNDFRTEAPMARKYIVDSLKFWVTEYGIDGFRFDLMALMDLETMKEVERELRAIRPDIVLYGEPWSAGPSTAPVPTNKQTIRGTKLGAFNDAMRNALVGSPFDAAHGAFLQWGNDREALMRAVQGQWRDWGDGPHQVIQYMSCHDNYVVYDKLKLSKPGASHADKIEMMKLGYFVLFTSQGVPFFHGGEEFARTKQGHHNSYEAPDEINQVDWSLKAQNADLYRYVRDLIALRAAHPAFRMRAKEQIAAWLQFHEHADSHLLMYTIDATHVAGESWKKICVIANAADSISTDVVLPPGAWHVAFDKGGTVATPPAPVQGTVRVRYKSGMILFQ